MKCIYVDTNVFLRFLTKDIPIQADLAEKYLRRAQRGELCMSILQVTIVEILFHLERFYDSPRSEAAEKLVLLIEPEWIHIDDKKIVMEALYEYKRNTIDFVDILTWAMAKAQNVEILSFDKDFDKLTPKLRIKP
ncbi:hypothetical protein CO051_05610 [Candidatus Roizmanbacteria bacterium CG_4_9_14_0_2_um_filter_39_13]|uniref:PIN domain-containing protein n=2 Tax=Candidatus Roizmaniibacteriota TaxID=1752723 RepID=A0A2M8EX70_9BACT|nr:MAG: hypothetical protein COY15_04820 [Candidatus Roizmanbacteria bacterium CG_4_10_14_0_2_um_filter_39_12]PJC30462.1 MAG: hypothetical protein CO051_05610 [Candidatus Roizmanbacteria bacterium CG_4_9_14_0_2_um_filter_39_13]PJE61662.1 MAG: hypothetical protein COU87_03430 [Candidatus Roizmanbacteria bacterium CG10_big_fil_rev_8_21_14_0_10_39_12]